MIARLAAVLISSLLASAGLASGRTIDVELNKEFRLKKGEVARFAGGRASLRIVKFINSPCPKGARCVWSGQAVITELTVDGKVVPAGAKDPPYDVTVKDSDYKTFALLLVDEPEAACSRPKAGHQGECLRALARRRGDPALCRKIDDERTRGFCLEDLAEELYLKAKKAGDRAACDAVVLFRWRERCIKELSP